MPALAFMDIKARLIFRLLPGFYLCISSLCFGRENIGYGDSQLHSTANYVQRLIVSGFPFSEVDA